jgi:lipopolysaccharide/colanic/teichoic acid biosynthesis glycosyltransferase
MKVMPLPPGVLPDTFVTRRVPVEPSHPRATLAGSSASSAPLRYGCAFVPLRSRRIQLVLKRISDVVVASCLMVVLIPVFVVVAALVRIDSGGPVFFGQSRVGRDMRLFRMWKFRTMCVGAHLQRGELDPESPVFPLLKVVNDPRATRIGRVLRRWSLDELPQFWNVVRGDISLVGPRPRLPEEVFADGLRQSLRLGVRPGVTGPWQVNGRSEIPYADGIALDLGYVRDWSLAMDLRILAKTPWAIISRKGAH